MPTCCFQVSSSTNDRSLSAFFLACCVSEARAEGSMECERASFISTASSDIRSGGGTLPQKPQRNLNTHLAHDKLNRRFLKCAHEKTRVGGLPEDESE